MPTSWRSRLLLGLAVLAAAVGLFVGVRALNAGDDTATPEPSQSAEPTASASASASAAPPERSVAQPRRFRVDVLSVKGEEVDSTNMFGRDPDSRPRLVKRAAGKAALVLQRYLNAAFVDPETRFSRDPIKGLLTDNARQGLSDRARRALGAEGPSILGGKTVSAKARAVVLHDGRRTWAVTLRYAAKMNVVYSDQQQRMTQTGTMVFRKLHNQAWRADFADVKLQLPNAPRSQEGTP